MERLHIFLWPLVILGVFFVISFFLSLSETALVGLSKIRLRHLVAKGAKNAKTVYKLISHLDRLITTILVGNNFVNIGISAIGTAICIYFLGQKWGIIVSTLVVTFLVLIFAEITPKVISSQHPENIALLVARPISFLIAILRPIVSVFMAITFFLIRLFGIKLKKRTQLITVEEMRLIIEVGKEDGAISDEERKMLHRIFEFGDTHIGEIMIPPDNIAAIDIKATPDELLDVVVEEGHSRIPVYRDSRENITGIIYARDLLHIWHSKGLVIIPDLVQPAYFVSKDKKVSELLRDFQRMKIQIAIAVDENKKALGLVTLEDLLEEIVGEIEEEHR